MGSLTIKNGGKTYGEALRVLRDVNITLEDGEFLVLVGPSGCGKSTLLNMIAGLESITEGTIEIDGKVVNDLEPADRDIAMVFQSYALYPNMTVAGNISFGLEIRKVPRPERDAAVQRVAELLQIGHLLQRRPSQLSGGQRQRVAMGRALVRDPKLFLFDEPLSNLDAKLRVEMRTEIKRLHAKTRTTIVYVTHDQIEAMTMATRICVLQGGVIQQQGTPDEIYSNPANAFVAGFMGSPPMNLFRARAAHSAKGWVLSVATPGGQTVALPYARPLDAGLDGREVTLGLRPEHIVEERPSEDGGSRYVLAEAGLEMCEPTGADTFGLLHLGGAEVTCRLKARTRLAPGQFVPLYFGMDHACLFDPESGARLENNNGKHE
jgi:multiple sugar transport system ATP-binding protein